MILAHGVGERHSLPVPLDLVLQGAAVALLVSFLALGLLWTKPRFTEAEEPAEREWWPIRALVLLGLLFVPGHLWPHLVFLWLWVGVAVASMLLGPVWRLLNPLRLVTRFSRGRPYPERLGHWPAAAQLLAFTWVELVEPHALPWFLVTYAVVNIAGGFVYGDTWFARADGFEVYSTLLGRLSPVHGNPFRRLMSTPVRPGLVAVIAVCLGATAYDSFGAPHTTWGLALMIGVIAISYLVCTRLHNAHLAHTLIPIVAGYVVAHYVATSPLAQVVAVLVGHIVAVVSAHDRTLALLPRQRQLTAQMPLLLLMICYTAGGLVLLSSG